MAETRRRDLRARLTALAGLVVIVGGAALVLFFAGVLGGQGGGETESGVKIEDAQVLAPPPAPGRGDLAVEPRWAQLAPDFEISDYNGVPAPAQPSFRGKAVYLNFWASWCVPCQAELPDMQELLDRHKDELIVDSNRREPLERARTVLPEHREAKRRAGTQLQRERAGPGRHPVPRVPAAWGCRSACSSTQTAS